MVDISALDYNTLKNKAEKLLGAGTGTFGYGQTVQSSSVFSGNTILASHWDDLRNDILSIKIHQDGVTPTIRDIAVGDVIDDTSADPKIQYANLLDIAESNKFQLAPEQSQFSAISTKTFSSAWSSAAELTLSASFSDATEARFFFNSGGKIQITTSRTGGSVTSQNASWTSTLDTVGTQSFGADTNPNVNFYTLTNNYQVFVEEISSVPYTSNLYKIEAKCDVANNSTGTATQVDLKITLTDAYTDPGSPAPGDSVDGTLEIDVVEQKAAGNLQPSGSFSITGPSYTVSNISAS